MDDIPSEFDCELNNEYESIESLFLPSISRFYYKICFNGATDLIIEQLGSRGRSEYEPSPN